MSSNADANAASVAASSAPAGLHPASSMPVVRTAARQPDSGTDQLLSFRTIVSSPDPRVASECHCLFCFDVLAAHFAGRGAPSPSFPSEVECPLFVTWNKRPLSVQGHPQLRGCIGCLKPLPLSSLREYALNSALRDRRFSPMRASELPEMQCTVQLLSRFERCDTCTSWAIGTHGITIAFVEASGAQRSAVYLPDVMVEQGWDHWQTLDSLIVKSGCVEPITDALRHSLTVCTQHEPCAPDTT